ncbi:hypothetical protein ACS94_00325 [Bacillus cereus]|nr:hypothetical protein ACS94_00325 [Bacillus cereus]
MAVELWTTVGSNCSGNRTGWNAGQHHRLGQGFHLRLAPQDAHGFLHRRQTHADVLTVLFAIGAGESGFQIGDGDVLEGFLVEFAIDPAVQNFQ